MRVEHEYDRGGALAYMAAYDVHKAQLFGRTEPTTGIEPFGRLVEQVMTVEPYASAKRVFWVVDNGSSHRGQASIDRLEGAWPNLRLIHLPIHASWLNQMVRSSSPSSNAKSSPPTTSPTWSRSATVSLGSRTATTPPPSRSTGDSPETTWPGSLNASPASTPLLRHYRPLPDLLQLRDPRRRIAQIQPTSTIQRLLRAPTHHPGGQERLLVIIVAGPLHGEPPTAGRTGVAQTEQRRHLIAYLPVHIGKPRPEPHRHRCQVRPPLPSPRRKPLAQRRLRRLRDLHTTDDTTSDPRPWASTDLRGGPLSRTFTFAVVPFPVEQSGSAQSSPPRLLPCCAACSLVAPPAPLLPRRLPCCPACSLVAQPDRT